jgi:hypothetical protein
MLNRSEDGACMIALGREDTLNDPEGPVERDAPHLDYLEWMILDKAGLVSGDEPLDRLGRLAG